MFGTREIFQTVHFSRYTLLPCAATLFPATGLIGGVVAGLIGLSSRVLAIFDPRHLGVPGARVGGAFSFSFEEVRESSTQLTGRSSAINDHRYNPLN